VLENTGQSGMTVPNTLAIIAAEAVVEQAKKYGEQVREEAERQRAEDRERARESLRSLPENAVQVSVGESNDAQAASSSSESDARVEPQTARGAVVDMNA